MGIYDPGLLLIARISLRLSDWCECIVCSIAVEIASRGLGRVRRFFNPTNFICSQSSDLSGIGRGIDLGLTRARGTDRAPAASVGATDRAPSDAGATRGPDPDRAEAAEAAAANPEGADPGAKAATEVERRGPPGESDGWAYSLKRVGRRLRSGKDD